MLSTFVVSFFLETPKPLTNALHIFRGRPTLKDVFERFRNGSSYHDTAYEILANYMRSMICSNELTYEITSENCFAKRCEDHNSAVQMPSSLSETDKQRDAMMKSKVAENNNTLMSTQVSERPFKKVNITISCIIIVIFSILCIRYCCFLVGLLTILFILCTVLLVNIFRIVCKTMDEAIANTLSDCNIFEKAEQLSPLVQVEESTNYPRSRFEQFMYFEGVKRHRHKLGDREPSRITVKHLARVFGKSRKIREAVRKYIKKNFPKSSRIHMFTSKGAFRRTKESYTNYARTRKVRKRIDGPTRNNGHKRLRNTRTVHFSKTLRSDNSSVCQLHSVGAIYKDLNHRIKCNEFNLARDIEKNPGPAFIDATKTIMAPYSQNNVALFSLNAGSQCAAMALTSLIYNYRNGIKSSLDLVNIMNIGNELYSGLSRLSGQTYLLLTELPEMVNVFDTNYKLHYSSSYTGTTQGTCASVDYSFCMPLVNAIETLLEGSYNAFLLTVQCNTVGIYCTTDGKYKIFDSHARDSCGMVDPQGTCVLLELETLNALFSYIQTFYKYANAQFELKGVHITEIQYETDNIPPLSAVTSKHVVLSDMRNNEAGTDVRALKCCCVVSLYCICFSVIKACGYWNAQTLDSIAVHGKVFYREKFKAEKQLDINNLPTSLQIYDTDVLIIYNMEKSGILFRTSVSSKLSLHKLITDNIKGKTGFLMWIGNCCTSCILQHNSKRKSASKYYITVFSDKGDVKMFQSIQDTDSLIEIFFNIVKEQFNYNEIEYCIKFLSCSSNLSNVLRQKVKRKHTATYHADKGADAKRKKMSYAELNSKEKQKVLFKSAQRYKSMDPDRKKQMLSDKRELSQKWYASLYPTRKENLLSKKAEWYKSLDKAEKEQLLSNRAEWYKSLNTTEKEQLLSNKAEWYKLLVPAEKEILLSRIRYNTQAMKELKQNDASDLNHCVAVFKSKIRNGPYYICSVCNRILYRKTVICLNKHKCNIPNLLTDVKSFDGKQYICKTCHSKASQGKVPSQAACNKLAVDEIPQELSVLEKLEQILIAQRIVFEKIVVMPKGQQRKIKGAICNVPVDCDETCCNLPRPPERSGIIMLKLKRKVEFKGHVYFQAVRPQIILHALNWLRINNPLYSNININISNIDDTLIRLQHDEIIPDTNASFSDEGENSANQSKMNNTTNNCNCNEQNSDANGTPDDEEIEDPLNEYRAPANETCLQSVLPDYPVTVEQHHTRASGSEVYSIAPGANKHPVSFMMDRQCEELAFPVLFPKGQFGYTAERQIKLSPVKYFNARLLHYSARFATNPEYLFFA